MSDVMETSYRRATGLMHSAVEREASDIHLVPGYAPTLRIHGRLVAVDDHPLEEAEVRRMVEAVAPDAVIARLDAQKNFDFSIALEHEGTKRRFRANVFYSHSQLCACLRVVPVQIPTFEWMGFPRELASRLVHMTNGLVIITGVTGSGKTTTLAALINLLNQEGGLRVLTVEEPVEYVHPRISSTMITQREVGRDVDSFYDGLKYGLRQDPDVIQVGEIRDRETAQMALSAAETGHLILTTMHTKDAKGAVTRFVDLFPHEAHDDVRVQLSLSLRAVVSQHLLPPVEGQEKRVLALEAMFVNQPVRIGIRFGKIDSIESAIQTGRRDGMLSLDDHLSQLMSAGRISVETARRWAKDPEALHAAMPARG